MAILPLSYAAAHCSSWDEDCSPEQWVNSSPSNRSSESPLLNPEELCSVKVKGWRTANVKVKGWRTANENISQQSVDDDDTLIEFTRPGANGEYIRLVVRNKQPSLAHALSASEWLKWNWASYLIHAEALAVRDESHRTAKTNISDRIAPNSKILVEFKQAKRRAVDTKDYDGAEKIKGDINKIKQAHIQITDGDGRVPLGKDQEKKKDRLSRT